MVKNMPANAGDAGDRFDPWVRKIPWRRQWQPNQYSCLEKSIDRGAWWATVHGVAKGWTGCVTNSSYVSHTMMMMVVAVGVMMRSRLMRATGY